MNNITKIDIQTLLNNNININNILIQIKDIMEIEYPDFIDWYKNTFIPGIEKNERNSILLLKNEKLIGFVNLKKTKKEKKISNIYIKSSINYSKHFELLINDSIKWLEKDDPITVLSFNELYKCMKKLSNKEFLYNWNVTNIINFDNHSYYLFNGYHEFKAIEDLIKQKRKKYIKNNKNY